MANDRISNNSGLVAVALVIRSRDGPRFVFHYPSHPNSDVSQGEVRYGTELDQSELDEESDDCGATDDSDLEDGSFHPHQTLGKLDLSGKADNSGKMSSDKRKPHHVDRWDGDDHYDVYGEQIVPWEHLLGFPTKDLESILTPSRAYHKKKFELSLDPLYFVSYPMHIRQDGLWKKKKKPKKSKKENKPGSDGDVESINEAKSARTEENQKSDNPAAAKARSEDEDDHGGMTMFNVVFILNISKEDSDHRIYDIYEHVIKNLHKALKHAQAQSNYVWKESELILGMKDKAREERRPMSWLWNQILVKSTLACAIKDIYTAVSNNKIATIHLETDPAVDLSLQIPVPFFLTSLPNATDRARPGLLLTTANCLIDDDGNEDPSHLNKHFALLLLEDKDKLISEIQAENTPLTAPLIEYIKLSQPTMSLLQVAQTNSISLPDVRTLAQHLIYWRRAMAIPPLHGRDTYIVSPNSDMHKLAAAAAAWAKTFPLAPSLPTFLANLSAAPRPYKSFAPSKDHRGQYMDMLAWLLRGGWVTQLRSYAWILVWPEIVYEIEYQLKAEAVEAAKIVKPADKATESADDSSSDNSNGSEPSAPLTTEQAAEKARLARVAAKAAAEAAADAADFAKKLPPMMTNNPSSNKAEHLKEIPPHIIIDPHKVGHTESLYISAIGKRIKDEKARETWPKFVKYFNGTEALESIGLREGMKRKETWGILTHYQEYLLVAKHW